jgi:anti-sigma factor RsiW
MNCPHVRELLSAYLDGELPEQRSHAVAEHLAQCSGCREELHALRVTSELVSSLSRPRLAADLSQAVVQRASVPAWRERWAAFREFVAPRRRHLVRELGRAAAVAAIFLVAAAAPDSRVGRLVVSWPSQVAGAAGTGMAHLEAGLSEAQAFLDERAAASAVEQKAWR